MIERLIGRPLHYAWLIVIVTFVTLITTAGFRATPGVLIVHCLGVCERCGAEHKGERKVGLGKQTKALDQEFHLYNDADRELVRRPRRRHPAVPDDLPDRVRHGLANRRAGQDPIHAGDGCDDLDGEDRPGSRAWRWLTTVVPALCMEPA